MVGKVLNPVRDVPCAGRIVDLRNVNALATSMVEGCVEAPDPREEVGEGERNFHHTGSLGHVFELVKLGGVVSPRVSRVVSRVQFRSTHLETKDDPTAASRVPPGFKVGLRPWGREHAAHPDDGFGEIE
jgi:hypothetical protein